LQQDRCYACDLTYTYRNAWYLNRDINNPRTILHVLCIRCCDNIILRPKRFHDAEQRRKFWSQLHLGHIPHNKGKRVEFNRECYACGSSKTRVDKTGRRHWAINRGIEDSVLCSKCDYHYIRGFGRHVPQLKYKGKSITLKHNPRTGFCSKCGNVGITDIHHQQYDDNDVLAHTIELCHSCHSKITRTKVLVP
jgi:hypothetical protein